MVCVILIHSDARCTRQAHSTAPDLIEHAGICYSLRAGPRTPQLAQSPGVPVAVYAPDELNEEAFQALYETARPQVPELNLRY